MKTYVQPGNAFTGVFPYARNAGDGVLFGGSLFGIAVDNVASGATGVALVEGVFSGVTKNTGAGEAYTIGQRLFWDNTNKRVTSTSTANTAIGMCWVAAATGDATTTMSIEASTPAGT